MRVIGDEATQRLLHHRVTTAADMDSIFVGQLRLGIAVAHCHLSEGRKNVDMGQGIGGAQNTLRPSSDLTAHLSEKTGLQLADPLCRIEDQ